MDPWPGSDISQYQLHISRSSGSACVNGVDLAVPAIFTPLTQYRKSLDDGTYYWCVRAQDNAGWYGPWSETWQVNVLPVYNAILLGHIYDMDGLPVSGATVLVKRNGVVIATDTSEPDGSYFIAGLPADTPLVVEVSHICWGFNPAYVEIPPGQKWTQDFRAVWGCG